MRKKTVTVKQIQKLDKIAIEKCGVPSLALMENAGRCVAQEIVGAIHELPVHKRKKILVSIVCGLGNNAGDGFVVARHLLNAGIKTNIFLIGKEKDLKHDAFINYRILEKLKYPVINLGSQDSASLRHISRCDIIVDAIFGVGLSREIKDPFKKIIEVINKSGKKIISIDIPSGLDGTTGSIYGVCVKAEITVTFSFAKRGFFINKGKKQTGKIRVADIGIPVKLRKLI